MSHKCAASKAFSAHMPIYIAFFGLTVFVCWGGCFRREYAKFRSVFEDLQKILAKNEAEKKDKEKSSPDGIDNE